LLITIRFGLVMLLFVAMFMIGWVLQKVKDRCVEIYTGRYVE